MDSRPAGKTDSVRQTGAKTRRVTTSSGVAAGAERLLAPPTHGHHVDGAVRRSAERAFGRDFSNVRVHADVQARAGVHGIGAIAASHGNHIFLGAGVPARHTAAYRAVLWHELAHVSQRAQQPTRPSSSRALLSNPTDSHERHAEAAAAGVVNSQTVGAHAAMPLISRQAHTDASTRSVTQIKQAMDSAPDAASGNRAALELLRQRAAEEALPIVVALDKEHRLERVAGELSVSERSPLAGMIFAVLHLSQNTRPTPSWGIAAAFVIASLPAADRMALLDSVLRATGRGDQVAKLHEGTEALEESEAQQGAQPVRDVDPATAAVPPVMGGVTPGPWNPGRIPVPFYIGNSAHVAIAAMYVAAHPGEEVFTNNLSVSHIVAAARRLGISVGRSRARSGQLEMEPDICNLPQRHLYEIKPATLESLGRSEALLYQAAFTAAGLPIGLGPTAEPGTSGVIPAPGGWYDFRAPQPGVITYNYRQPPRVRVRVPVQLPAPQRQPARSKSLHERISEITGLTGTALTIYLIISEGSRLFPPRNLIPAP